MNDKVQFIGTVVLIVLFAVGCAVCATLAVISGREIAGKSPLSNQAIETQKRADEPVAPALQYENITVRGVDWCGNKVDFIIHREKENTR